MGIKCAGAFSHTSMTHEPMTPESIEQLHREGLARMATKLSSWSADFVLRTLDRIVERRDLEMMANFKQGFLSSRIAGTSGLTLPSWQTLPLAPASWLRDEDAELRAFAGDWMETFKGSSDLAQAATKELLRVLEPANSKEFHLVRAQGLADMAMPAGGDRTAALAPLLDKLLDPKSLSATKLSLANDAALLEYVARAAALAQPQQMLVLADGRNLVTAALRSGKTLCLEALASVYDQADPVFRAAACQAMREVMGMEGYNASPLDIRAEPILRGWLDADTANAVLTSTCVTFWLADGEDNEDDQIEHKISSTFGGALAAHWVYMPEALGLVRALQAAGGDLDIMATVQPAEDSLQQWTGTLLHQAVAHGTPELVAYLLKLGCDPFLKSTLRNGALDPVVERDCFEIIDAACASANPNDAEPHMKRRHAEVAQLMLGWRAHRRANDAIANLVAEAPHAP